jgi:molybdate transport system substrate-binding protein
VPRFPLLIGVLALAACTRPETTTVTVFAAASLTASFRAIEQAYEREHPNVDIQLSFAGSQLLAAQLLEGAPAQVFASADGIQVDRVADQVELTGRRPFASNRLVLAVPVGSSIAGIWDLIHPGVRLVLANEAVPAGRYARAALTGTINIYDPILANVISNEPDVRAVAAKVRMGEADAGIVYATDVIGDPELELRELPGGANDYAARYELAVVVDPKHADLQTAALSFADFVTSPAGQAILAEHGFGPISP